MLQRNMFVGAVLAASMLAACAGEPEDELLGVAQQGVGGTGFNDVSPEAIDANSLSQGVTNDYGITNSSHGITDPLQLCITSTVTSSGCTMRQEWEAWVNDSHHSGNNAYAHQQMMKGIAKCAVEPTFTIQNTDGSLSFPGQWPLYTSWKTNRLSGQDKHERVSACILTLLNGNDESLQLCIIGPGGSPFSDACSRPATSPCARAATSATSSPTPPPPTSSGPDQPRCTSTGATATPSQGTYCCDERDTSCSHHIVRAGAMEGSDSRCNGFAYTGPNNQYEYCTSFWTRPRARPHLLERLHDLHPADPDRLTSSGSRLAGGRRAVAALQQRGPPRTPSTGSPCARSSAAVLLPASVSLRRPLHEERALDAPAPAAEPGAFSSACSTSAQALVDDGARRRRRPRAHARAPRPLEADLAEQQPRSARSGTFSTASRASVWACSRASRNGCARSSAHAACSARIWASTACSPRRRDRRGSTARARRAPRRGSVQGPRPGPARGREQAIRPARDRAGKRRCSDRWRGTP